MTKLLKHYLQASEIKTKEEAKKFLDKCTLLNLSCFSFGPKGWSKTRKFEMENIWLVVKNHCDIAVQERVKELFGIKVKNLKDGSTKISFDRNKVS